MYTLLELESKTFGELKKIGSELDVLPEGDRRRRESWINAIAGINPPLLQLLETSPAEDVQAQESPIIETVEASPGVEVDPVQEPISQVAKTSPDVEVDPVQEALPECFECFGDGYVEDAFGFIKCCSHCLPENKSEPKVSQSAIALSDQNPILTGILLSDRFLARYAPPQSETLHYEITDGYNVDTDGQLSLFDVQVQSPPEPPDPDDFESLDAFREAIALWDAQNPEPPAVSMDSMCEWAPCPEDWYEPEAEILPSKALLMSEVLELLGIGDSSDTSDFFIPTFGRLGDRSDKGDEPPDTGGIFARLPKPKPPSFPPQASQPKSGKVSLSQSGIPKLFPRVVAGSSTQPARSPPRGDA